MSPILNVRPLGFVWDTLDPFLFCVHHDDAYPAGTDSYGPPRATLSGRNIGNDFELRDGWRMYHGQLVPGFPAHPHRGFETVTIVRKGYIDHADSMGAKARYGEGDVQWLTAGKGIVHAEMFPLLRKDSGNRAELFQIWLNLPKRNKMVEPHFTMLWGETVPHRTVVDGDGRRSEITVIAGSFGDAKAGSPPPDSWASQPGSDVQILTGKMSAGARLTLPAAPAGTHRMLYVFAGEIGLAGGTIPERHGAQVRPELALDLIAGATETEFLILGARPIGEPVVAHGPFVMNTASEIQQAFADYQRTRFGGWPHATSAPVHGGEIARFALRDGKEERPPRS